MIQIYLAWGEQKPTINTEGLEREPRYGVAKWAKTWKISRNLLLPVGLISRSRLRYVHEQLPKIPERR